MEPSAVRDQFNAAAPSYGGWHRRYAERLVELTHLAPGQRVLDVGTGTGFAALAAARVVAPGGQVIGIDIADQMIDQARLAARQSGITNATFSVGDAGRLPFEGASFDAVVCSSAIIYMPLPTAVEEWRRVLRPSVIAAFSTLRSDAPRTGVVFREVAASFGVALTNPNQIGSPGACRALMRATGFDRIQIAEEALQGDTTSPAAAWEGNLNSAAFADVRRLPAADVERMRDAYLARLNERDLSEPYRALFVVARR